MSVDEPKASGLQVNGSTLKSPLTAILSRPVFAVAVVLGLGTIVEFTPGLAFFKIFSPHESVEVAPSFDAKPELVDGEAELKSETQVQQGLGSGTRFSLRAQGPIGPAAPQVNLQLIAEEEPPLPLTDPTGHTLDHFFHALKKTQNKEQGALTRIAHFGDSIVVSDYVSGTLRRKLQKKFGDAGHGYMLIANAWPAYFHNDVFRFATAGFRISRIVGPTTKDGFYGLGGVTFRAYSGVRARYGTASKGDYGRAVSRFVLTYLARPHGGNFELIADGTLSREISTKSKKTEVRSETIELEDGEHQLELIIKRGESRLFGVSLERDVPGVILDALGVQGARIRFLDKQNDEHFAERLRWSNPNLLVFQFGANESGDGYAYSMPDYQKTMQAVIRQAQAALPQASCLIIGAMDRARKENGSITSMKIIQLIIKEQERAAKELGCAYFNTYDSMGGWGSMPAWVRRGLGQADMTHPTGIGAQRIGNWIYRALMQRYDQYLKKQIP